MIGVVTADREGSLIGRLLELELIARKHPFLRFCDHLRRRIKPADFRPVFLYGVTWRNVPQTAQRNLPKIAEASLRMAALEWCNVSRIRVGSTPRRRRLGERPIAGVASGATKG